MANHRRAEDDRGYSDIPDRETEEIRDETEEEDEFDDTEDLEDEEEEDADLGKNVREQERATAASSGFTAEIGSEGGSSGETEVERRRARRVNAGEATTTVGEAADEARFARRRQEEE